MGNLAALREIFGRYAGQEIKNPRRITADCDAVMDGLAQEVRQEGFLFGAAQEKGAADIGCMAPPSLVTPEFERGADRKLRLTGKFKLGN